MQLPELLHALRHLGLGGMATSLEARLVQAQADHSAHADFLALLLQDELTRRADRLLTRRLKEAQFRDPDKTLDGFDFAFNKKMAATSSSSSPPAASSPSATTSSSSARPARATIWATSARAPRRPRCCSRSWPNA